MRRAFAFGTGIGRIVPRDAHPTRRGRSFVTPIGLASGCSVWNSALSTPSLDLTDGAIFGACHWLCRDEPWPHRPSHGELPFVVPSRIVRGVHRRSPRSDAPSTLCRCARSRRLARWCLPLPERASHCGGPLFLACRDRGGAAPDRRVRRGAQPAARPVLRDASCRDAERLGSPAAGIPLMNHCHTVHHAEVIRVCRRSRWHGRLGVTAVAFVRPCPK